MSEVMELMKDFSLAEQVEITHEAGELMAHDPDLGIADAFRQAIEARNK